MVHPSQQQALPPSQDVAADLPEGDRHTPEQLADVVAVRKEMHDRLARIMMRAKAA